MLESYTQQLANRLTEATAVGREIDLRSRHISELAIAGASPNDQYSLGKLRQDAQRELSLLKDDNRRIQQTCEDALRKFEAIRTKQNVKDVNATDDSVALAGYINADDDYRVDQDISNVVAKKNSLAIAGVAKNFDISGFFAKR